MSPTVLSNFNAQEPPNKWELYASGDVYRHILSQIKLYCFTGGCGELNSFQKILDSL